MRLLDFGGAVGVVTVLVTFAGAARGQAGDDRARHANSARVAIDAASAREDWAALQDAAALADRLLASAPGDPLLQHYRGYALFRLALVSSRRDSKAMTQGLLSGADRVLESSGAVLPLAETHALRASVLGQMIGLTRNPFVAMRLGPRSGAEMKRALELGPENPRVWFLRGLNTMHTPKMWGGGLGPAEEYLLKARALFLADTARAPSPTWGKADVEIALGQVHLMQHRLDDARDNFARALALQPENSWVKDTLMQQAAPQATRGPTP